VSVAVPKILGDGKKILKEDEITVRKKLRIDRR